MCGAESTLHSEPRKDVSPTYPAASVRAPPRSTYLSATGCMTAPASIAGWKSAAWNGSSVSPNVVVPSGQIARAPRPGALAALDVDRADQRAQPSHQRPGAYLGLRDEGRRQHGVDHEDVEPGDVVEHQHAGVRQLGRAARLAHRHRQDGEQLPRPAPLFRRAVFGRESGIAEGRDQQAMREVRAEARDTREARPHRRGLRPHGWAVG